MANWLRQLFCGHHDKMFEEKRDGSRKVQCLACEKVLVNQGPRWEVVTCKTCGSDSRHLFPATYVHQVPDKEPVPYPGMFCSYVCYDVFCKHVEQGVPLS